MNPLIVIHYCEQNAAALELLLAWIYRLNGKEKKDAILLIGDHETHPETQWRMRVSAEEFFSHVESIVAPKTGPGNKVYKTNQAIKFAAQYIQNNYRLPWVWLEPDCVPLKSDWLGALGDAHHDQPKRYLCGHQIWNKEKNEVSISRIGVYPQDAWTDLQKLCDTNQPFERYGGKALLRKSTKTGLFQNVPEFTDPDQLKTDAVVLHRDKTGTLIRWMINDMERQSAT